MAPLAIDRDSHRYWWSLEERTTGSSCMRNLTDSPSFEYYYPFVNKAPAECNTPNVVIDQDELEDNRRCGSKVQT